MTVGLFFYTVFYSKISDINKLLIQKMYAKNELEAALIEVQSRTKEVAPK